MHTVLSLLAPSFQSASIRIADGQAEADIKHRGADLRDSFVSFYFAREEDRLQPAAQCKTIRPVRRTDRILKE